MTKNNMNNKIIVYNKNTKTTVKRNLFNLPILSIDYTTSITKDDKTKTTCTISWYDPIYNTVRTTKASTVKHPKDKYNEVFAKRLAESRCKYAIYSKYYFEVNNVLDCISRKHYNLSCTEYNNQCNLINNL